jgi:hypothetical protein
MKNKNLFSHLMQAESLKPIAHVLRNYCTLAPSVVPLFCTESSVRFTNEKLKIQQPINYTILCLRNKKVHALPYWSIVCFKFRKAFWVLLQEVFWCRCKHVHPVGLLGCICIRKYSLGFCTSRGVLTSVRCRQKRPAHNGVWHVGTKYVKDMGLLRFTQYRVGYSTKWQMGDNRRSIRGAASENGKQGTQTQTPTALNLNIHRLWTDQFL